MKYLILTRSQMKMNECNFWWNIRIHPKPIPYWMSFWAKNHRFRLFMSIKSVRPCHICFYIFGKFSHISGCHIINWRNENNKFFKMKTLYWLVASNLQKYKSKMPETVSEREVKREIRKYDLKYHKYILWI